MSKLPGLTELEMLAFADYNPPTPQKYHMLKGIAFTRLVAAPIIDELEKEIEKFKTALDLALEGAEDAESLWCSEFCGSFDHVDGCVRATKRLSKIRSIMEEGK